MGLEELRERMSRAIEKMSNGDENVLNICLDDIVSALLGSDVNAELVLNFRNNIDKTVKVKGFTNLKFINQSIFDELCNLFDSATIPPIPCRTIYCVHIFVGFKGSGKTMACLQYANHYHQKRWRPAVVDLADTRTRPLNKRRMHDFEQFNKLPIYGCHMVSDDHVKAMTKGLKFFKKWCRDLVVVDTIDCHENEPAPFENIIQLSQAAKPYLFSVILVVDSTLGQAVFDQVQTFKQNFPNGFVVLTKLDVTKTSVGALSAIAAAKVPVVFVQRGEHSDQLEEFDVNTFVSHLLGLGDSIKFKDKYLEYFNSAHEQRLMRNDQERCRRFKTILGLMKIEGLDVHNPNILSPSFIMKMAEGCGYQVTQVQEILEEYKHMADIHERMLKLLA